MAMIKTGTVTLVKNKGKAMEAEVFESELSLIRSLVKSAGTFHPTAGYGGRAHYNGLRELVNDLVDYADKMAEQKVRLEAMNQEDLHEPDRVENYIKRQIEKADNYIMVGDTVALTYKGKEKMVFKRVQ